MSDVALHLVEDMSEDTFMSVSDMAAEAGVSKETIRNAITDLKLTVIRGQSNGRWKNGIAKIDFENELLPHLLRHQHTQGHQNDISVLAASMTEALTASPDQVPDDMQQAIVKKAMEFLDYQMRKLQERNKALETDNELLKARVQIADSFRTVDRYINENGIDLDWCHDNGLGKGLVGVGLKLSKWFQSLPAERQMNAVTEVNIGKYKQKSYRMDILDEYFDVE